MQQQIDIEKAVHATQAEFLRQIAAKMADDSSNWASRHDGDLAAREKELEVGRGGRRRRVIKGSDFSRLRLVSCGARPCVSW